MPVFVVGASIGRLYGELIAVSFPEGMRGIEYTQIFPGIYSIVGMIYFKTNIFDSFATLVSHYFDFQLLPHLPAP